MVDDSVKSSPPRHQYTAPHVVCCSAAITLLRLRREVEASHNPAELILHVGDLSYADGNPHIWNSFFEGLQPFAASVPYMVAVGNHEVMPDAEHNRLGDTILWHVLLFVCGS